MENGQLLTWLRSSIAVHKLCHSDGPKGFRLYQIIQRQGPLWSTFEFGVWKHFVSCGPTPGHFLISVMGSSVYAVNVVVVAPGRLLNRRLSAASDVVLSTRSERLGNGVLQKERDPANGARAPTKVWRATTSDTALLCRTWIGPRVRRILDWVWVQRRRSWRCELLSFLN